jgi:hypothetical protein
MSRRRDSDSAPLCYMIDQERFESLAEVHSLWQR